MQDLPGAKSRHPLLAAGQLGQSRREADKQADKNANNKDAIIWHLEQGAVLRANGQYEDSNKAFETAQEKMDDYAQKAKVRLGQETGALLSNQAELDYEGRAYDGIMLNTYMALNYLALGEPDKARPELIRAYQRQQDAVQDNAKRIEKVQDEAAKNKDSAAIQRAQNDPGLQSQIQNASTNLNNLKPYAAYVNPFTVYLDGLFFMTDAVDSSDVERARKSFERVTEMAPDNRYVREDLAMVNGLINGQPLAPTTFVIFETGCAPVRDQVGIDIPIIVAKVSYIGAAFPTLKPQGNYVPSLAVTADGKNFGTSWFPTWTASSALISKMKCRSSSPKPSRPPSSRAWPRMPRTQRPDSKVIGQGCSPRLAPPFIRPPSTSPTNAHGRRCQNNFRPAISRRRRIEKLN